MGVSFDWSYTYVKNKGWQRCDNVFGLSKDIIEKLESPTKVKVGHRRREASTREMGKNMGLEEGEEGRIGK